MSLTPIFALGVFVVAPGLILSGKLHRTVAALADYIGTDLRAARNAAKSGHFPPFVDINRRLAAQSRELEEAFMRYNISGERFREIGGEVERLLAGIKQNVQPLREK